MPDWPEHSSPVVTDLTARLAESENYAEHLEESMADLERGAEDAGWARLGMTVEQELTRPGLQRITDNARVMAIASPLIKRGLQLRIGYVWGQGVTVQGRAGEGAGQDVNAVVDAFWNDESNQAALTSSQAQEELERALGTDGQIVLAFFTDPVDGRVQVRSTPFAEIADKITNPEDRDEPWFYLREYDTTVVRGFRPARGPLTTRTVQRRVRVVHPALGFRPAQRPSTIDGMPVLWDTPLLHVPVNRLDGTKWGIPDAYAALPWARAYDGFLTDWARLVKSLSKFAWRLTGDRPSKAQRAAERLRAAAPTTTSVGSSQAGGVAASGPGQHLEAIPKSGATIDSESGRPLAAMVAASLGIPVTTLLADPGTTGARAVAETLDKPTTLEMTMRRNLWTSVFQTVLGYVVDQAVKAPRGPLRGTVRRVGNREEITLAGDTERTIEVLWPDLNDLDPIKLVQAIVAADGTGKMPPEHTARMLLQALGVRDVDDILDDFFDDDGNWVDPTMNAGQAAVDRFRRGEDPASFINGDDPDPDAEQDDDDA